MKKMLALAVLGMFVMPFAVTTSVEAHKGHCSYQKMKKVSCKTPHHKMTKCERKMHMVKCHGHKKHPPYAHNWGHGHKMKYLHIW